MVKISIVSLIYKSKRFAEWVYESVHKFTPMIHIGNAEFFFIANDPEGDLVDFLTAKGYKFYININPRRTEEELFKMGYAKPEYIHRVYRGWNEAIRKSQGELVVLVNSDNYFSPDWLENLLKFSSPNTVVCSQLVERKHPKYDVFSGAYHGEFGNHPDNFKEDEFLSFANKVRMTGIKQGGAFMPCMFYKNIALKAGLYPEGNIAGRNFDDVAFYGDEYFFNNLAKLGVKHITSLDSIVYHLKEGEMDEIVASQYHIQSTQSVKISQDKPFFSVIIPTYNQSNLLNEALDSLINQTFKNWEAIVVNDGSTDNTSIVMDDYSKRDSRIKCFYKENGGTASALNYGIKQAKGEWICWLSSDDLFEPNKLEIHFNAIKKNPDIKFFHSHWYLLLEETKQKIAPALWLEIPPTEFQVTRFFWANYIHGNAIAIHKSVFDDVGFFDETLRQGQDFDMWLRISSKYKSHFINERTCVTRIHKGQTTNSFLEGGVLDSTRALIKFLNEKNFYDLFPFTDFNLPQNILNAINEIIYISTRQNAFLYRCGYTTALVEKTMSWFTNEIPVLTRDKLLPFIKNIVNKYLEEPFIPEIKSILKVFVSYKKVIFQPHDFIKNTINYAKELILLGDQKQAKAIETYLIKILNIEKKDESSENLYEPILLGFPYNNEYDRIDPENITYWKLEPSGMLRNSIRHYIKMICNNCNMNFNIQLDYEMDSYYSSQNFVCPGCKKGFQYDDKNFSEDFLKFHYKKINETGNTKTNVLKVAFFIRDASVLGGGTKVFFNYIKWLLILGADVTVYSFSKKPDWIKIKVKYIHIQNELEIKTNYNIFFVFSIFDVPLILNSIPINKVVHICQGYEGYHFGSDYNKTRSDKHILTQLHAIPVRNILVSTHLIELFNSKFQKEYEYIPNGIDHKIFSFVEYKNREKTILFVGNPLHPLKGFSFLASAIKIIQQSSFKIEHLKLCIIIGFKPDNLDQIIKQLSEEILCEIDIKVNLDNTNVAKLMQSSSIVVCTSWYEGFSLPLLEAMACGTPVITTYNGGAESFCKNDFNSIMVNYGDINSLSQNIVNIIYGKKDIKNLIENAYKSSKKYSEYNSVIQFISAMEKFLKTKFKDQNKKKLLDKYLNPDLETNNKSEFEDYKVSITPVSQFDLRKKTHKPKCYDGETNDYSLLPYKNLLSLELTPITYAGKFNYKLLAQCPKCLSEIKITDYIDISTKPTEIKFICTNCLTGFKIIDGEIGKYLMQQVPANKQENNFENKIAFVASGLDVKSGKTIVYTKYMNWLKKAGCELTIYSDLPKGNWTDIPDEYIVVKNFNDIDFSQYAYVFIHSVLDLVKIISKVNPEKIVYVCQAYEGFLYGDSYKSLRTDKPLFQSLHSIPFKAVAVSKHLKNFLETNFGKETFLVTNSVDLNCFYPDKKIVKDKNTILFIGNPVQPLKGLNFISAAIKSIQNSQYRIENLKLVIVVGMTTNEVRKNIEKLKNLINCKVYFFYDLDSKQMAELFNSSSVYVCCSWYEGFSLSILESMACGTPVITTKNMGAESFCRDGYNSILVDYGDVTGLIQNILKILNGQFDTDIIDNGLKTASEHSEYHSRKLFADFISTLKLKNINVSNLIMRDNLDESNIFRLNSNKNQKQIVINKKLSITYLISKINSISGGNTTLLYQTNELIRRGHKVTIVSYSEQPEWFSIKSEVLKIPLTEPMHKYVPRSDVVIATYFQNAFELEKIDAPVKIYFAQGDQFIFDDEWLNSAIVKNSYLQELKDLSFKSYLIKDVKLVLNSDTFAKLVFEKTGRNADGILKVGINTSIYHPLDKQQKGFRKRILLVGPDNLGTITEPLYFKGMLEAKSALSKLKKEFKNFTLVRMSNTKPDIFKNFDCEFYFNPSDELKTYLYGTADILLYPSHYESWGLPPLEAMASKTAVVCTKNIGSEDYCVDQQNCLLIQPKSQDDIYYALKKLLTDDDLLEKIVEGGYFTALKYTKEKEWDNLENMIFDFCEGKIELNKEIEELNDDMLKNEILNLLNKIDTKIKNNNFMDAFVLIKELMNNYSENEIKAVGVENTDIQNLAGNVALLIGEIEEAQKYFEKELNLNPQSSSACYGLGRVFFAQENYEAAKTMFEWAIKNDPNNLQANQALEDVNISLGIDKNHNSLVETNSA